MMMIFSRPKFPCFFLLVLLCIPNWKAKANDVPIPAPKPSLEQTIEDIKDNIFNILPKRKPNINQAEVKKEYIIFPEKTGPFTDRQSYIYRDIFALQSAGKISEANERIYKLNSSLLMGHVLAERYLHPTAYNSQYEELKAWLLKYADHPQADAIYKLAVLKNPQAEGALIKPRHARKISGNLSTLSKRGKKYISQKKRDNSAEKRVQKLTNEIQDHVEKSRPTLAFNILNNDYALQFMDDIEYDRLRSEIASGYFFAGELNLAEKLAADSLERSAEYAPLAGWVKGLINWQQGQFSQAAQDFEVAASSAYSSGWLISAAAYWASRAHLRNQDMANVSKWLEISASYPRTFYGLIAAQALGRVNNFNWSAPSLQQSHINFLQQLPKGRRAIALVKSEQKDLAELELQTLVIGNSQSGQEALVAFANYYNLPSVLMRLGNAYYQPQGSLNNAALYPVPTWEPENGYRVDRALIFAIARQESRFNNLAQNPSGATGLMQLMPATANYIAGKNIFDKPEGQYQLKKPEVNLKIGQKYIQDLLDHSAVQNDLLSLTMAYNAGPGNLSKWKRERQNITDPLLFIETIPYTETRAFIERVMANYWIYRLRLHQDTPSLKALAEGKWAIYEPQDADVRKVAFKN